MSTSGLTMAHALTTIHGQDVISAIIKLVSEHNIGEIVVGLPRSLNGNETDQTRLTQQFIDQLASNVDIPVQIIDEAGTSARAREQGATDDSVDQAAAQIILQDYLEQQ